MGEIFIHQDDIDITIQGESERSFGQDLYTQAVITLIEEADVGGWEKDSDAGEANALSDFCAAILSAVTKLYAGEGLLTRDEQAEIPRLGKIFIPTNRPIHEVLLEMIGYIRNEGYLTEEIDPGSGLHAEEPEDLN
jgi:hypothetical protein